jgi:thiol:disulfide interchange protein
MFKLLGLVRRHVFMCGLAAAAGLMLLAGCSEQQGGAMTDSGTYTAASGTPSSQINWNRLTNRSVSENRSVYLLFTAPWCPHCREFERDTLSRSDVQQALGRVIYVRANFDRERNLAHRYGFTGIPSGVLLRPQNHDLVVVDKHVGGLSPARFINFLNQAAAR